MVTLALLGQKREQEDIATFSRECETPFVQNFGLKLEGVSNREENTVISQILPDL